MALVRFPESPAVRRVRLRENLREIIRLSKLRDMGPVIEMHAEEAWQLLGRLDNEEGA